MTDQSGFDALGSVLATMSTASAVAFPLLGRLTDVAGRSAVVGVGLCSYAVMISALLLLPPPPPGAWAAVCVGLYPIITSQYSSTALYQLSYSMAVFKRMLRFSCTMFF